LKCAKLDVRVQSRAAIVLSKEQVPAMEIQIRVMASIESRG